MVVRILLCFAALATARSSYAEPITFYFGGRITVAIGQMLDDSVYPGAIYTGHYTFDSDSPLALDTGNLRRYAINGADPNTWELAVGKYTFRERGAYRIQNANLVSDNWWYHVDKTAAGSDPVFYSDDGDLEVDGEAWIYGMFLTSESVTASTLDLPLVPPPLDAFEGRIMAMFTASVGPGAPRYISIRGTVAALSDEPIPEPTALALCLLGVVLLALRRR